MYTKAVIISKCIALILIFSGLFVGVATASAVDLPDADLMAILKQSIVCVLASAFGWGLLKW